MAACSSPPRASGLAQPPARAAEAVLGTVDPGSSLHWLPKPCPVSIGGIGLAWWVQSSGLSPAFSVGQGCTGSWPSVVPSAVSGLQDRAGTGPEVLTLRMATMDDPGQSEADPQSSTKGSLPVNSGFPTIPRTRGQGDTCLPWRALTTGWKSWWVWAGEPVGWAGRRCT